MNKKTNTESNYKLRKEIKELKEKLLVIKGERDNFRSILLDIFDAAIINDAINAKWILELFRLTIFKVRQ